MKRVTLAIALLSQLTVAALAATSDEPVARPNVILILADDLATGDLAGGDGHPTRTPNLDRLASQSAVFTQAYSASCVCAPARAALLTGRYPHRTGVVTLNMNKFPDLTRLQPDEVTIADLLSRAGYRTGLIGKWHIGRGDGFHPLDRGFEEFTGFDGSTEVGYFKYRFVNQRDVAVLDDEYLTDRLNRQAIDFVRRHRDEPFFLHLAHYAPHRPLEAPQAAVDRYLQQGFDESTATIYAMIEIMDHGIGELLDELDRLQLSDRTIVVFASDNGPDPLTGERFNHGLRGTKYQVYEGGIRVPLFVRFPEIVPPGSRDQLVTFVDILPTLLELLDVDSALPNALDGRSFVSVLKNPSAMFASPRYWQWNRGQPNYTHNAAMREGSFKLVRPYVTRGLKLTDSNLPPVLFDLASDPAEQTDVSKQHPDVVRRMRSDLERWSQQVESDRTRIGIEPRAIQGERR